MPFGERDYAAMAEKAELKASRAPNPALQYHWKQLAAEYRKLADLQKLPPELKN